jgi:(1->4)-alpha-D-glucan 1-alpha-D-glucosylmutase
MTLDELVAALGRPDAPTLRIPVATYRLQLGPHLTFDDAAALVPYLAGLGITDCYISPFFDTASDASHGYDVSDHNRLRDELGGEAAFGRFAGALETAGLGLVVDLVPNHMGIGRARNACWLDVLEHGASSSYAHYFDIDWAPVKPELENKVLLPILGDHYGAALDAGHLKLELDDGKFRIRYFDTVLPVAPRTYVQLFRYRLDELEATLGAEHPALLELKAMTHLYLTIPHRTETDPERLAARQREIEIAQHRFVALLKESGDVRDFIEENVRRFNGSPGDSRQFDLLDELLQDQVYRLAFWRVAGEEINYRRFFDINELAAIRMEDPRVFAETHRLVFRLVREGTVTGLRIDHPDGLYAPAEYFRRLQRACFLERARRLVESIPGADASAWRDRDVLEAYDAASHAAATPLRPFYIVAEKILAPGERLPETWAVHGTTGYDFLNVLNGIFVDRSQARAMDQLYSRWTRERPSFTDVVYQGKRLIMETSMSAELNTLGHRLDLISEKHRSSRDFTLGSLTRALREVVACFPVYRTYFGETGDGAPRSAAAHQADRDNTARAIAGARRRTPTMDASIYDWLEGLLTLRFPEWAEEADRRERTDFVMRFQQITGPVTAKGYEDTALYRYNRLVSLNEVGGEPARFGTPLGEFHAAMLARQRDYPHGLSTTSTHDTKRGEDVRARINVLSEVPGEWRKRVSGWHKLMRKHRSVVDGQPVPGPNEEYLLFQTLVGAWPIGVERLCQYVLKAIHEAKVHTSWINPHARYDEAMVRFVETLLDPEGAGEFLADFVPFQAWVAHFAAFSGLAQVLVKITAPGVPDFYQGTELWDLSLVDPDNRRPVDFGHRRRLLEELTGRLASGADLAALARELVEHKEDGQAKLFLVRQALAFRRQHAALFQAGEYRPVEVEGPLAEHVCAFARADEREVAVTVIPRLLARRGLEELPLGAAYWGNDTYLLLPEPTGMGFVDVLTGERLAVDGGRLPVATVFGAFPVTLLRREP